jgi:hypothetical protein
MIECARNEHIDFHHESNVNQGTMFPILQAYCSCGNRIGCFQRTIESEIGKEMIELSKDDSLNMYDIQSKARRNTFKKLGFRRDCCLLALTMYPFLTVNDIEGEDAYVDFTEKIVANTVATNHYIPLNIPNRPGEFFPVKRDDIGFDMGDYCRTIHEITFNSNQNNSNGYTGMNIVTFPNIKTKTQTYPNLDLPYDPDDFHHEELIPEENNEESNEETN